jgi:hypothetical protein
MNAPVKRPVRVGFAHRLHSFPPAAFLPIASLALIASCGKAPEVPAERKATLASYLKANGMPPADYVVARFTDHDVVFLGELHLIREDVAFVERLLPELYHRAGVRALAIEFACSEDQASIDTLLADPLYQWDRAIQIQRRFYGGMWPYEEYAGLFKAVWQLNRGVPGADPMRLIALSPYIDWEKINYGDERARQEEEQKLALTDRHMAEVLLREAIANRLKTLVYCGRSRAFTRFQQPVVRDGELVGLDREQLGNLIYQRIEGRAMTVLLHSPWPTYGGDGDGRLYRPCNGILDAVLEAHADSVGFDVVGSPFGELEESRSTYRLGHPGLKLADVCDGYVFHKPLMKLHGVSLASSWITSEEDLARAKRQAVVREWAETVKSPREFMDGFWRDIAIPARFEGVR